MLEKLCTPLSAAVSEEITLTTPQHHHHAPSNQNEAVNNIADIPDESKLEEDESTKTKEKESTTRKHAEFRRRFRRTSMSSDICDGLPTNFRPKPKN
ncbi:hypothetical protein F2Q70_00031196 [Brassica cretica]|uniref:Uncharacterized protein n=1 Tax=Brassica cretica TaxID=69181 RepID=A0A8S9H0X4_BRACR|nr:hypothetical protein F2Q70_00031196 [Brassica cretica]KAF2550790.1 hypothetical protein F2Q68_00035546 [Brassica cretica]